MAKFKRQKQAITDATPSCSYLQQPQEILREEEMECTRINIAKSVCDNEWLPRKVHVQPVPQSNPEPELKPKIWMGPKFLRTCQHNLIPYLKRTITLFAPLVERYALVHGKTSSPIWTGRNWKRKRKNK